MKKLGRWVLILLALEFLFAWWIGSRIRDRYEAPLRIIGHAPPAQTGDVPHRCIHRLSERNDEERPPLAWV